MGTNPLERLRKLDSCSASDALDACGREGVLMGLVPLSTGTRFAGRAITVQLGVDDGRTTNGHLGTSAVEAATDEHVIVVANNGRTDVAGWGGLLSLGASKQGVAGVVIDGACRDVDEARELGLPVFARAAVPRTARSRIIEHYWNKPVEICGLKISPGDYVIADASGIVVIPGNLAEDILDAAERIVAKEALMAQAVIGGELISRVMGSSYEDMIRKMP